MREPTQLELFPGLGDEDRSVISIATRDVWVPPEVDAMEVEMVREEPPVDRDATIVCRMIYDDLAAGKRIGLAMLTWDTAANRFNYVVSLPNTSEKRAEGVELSALAMRWCGGIDMLKEKLLDVAVVSGGYEDYFDQGEDLEEGGEE